MSNSNFCIAKINKNDEFYTTLSDVEKELCYYEPLLFGKSILCNCNDGEDSAFWLYLSENFVRLGLKRLFAIKYGADSCGYALEMERVNGVLVVNKRGLYGNGDFRSKESIAFLRQADIVITNPPFSHFREYISLLTNLDKKYLVIGNMNAITFSEVFPLMRDNKLWIGYNSVRDFMIPNGSIAKLSSVMWFTNLLNTSESRSMEVTKRYTPILYPNFDNYDGINIDRVANIPMDYYGRMGVPISFITKYNPKQFEIIGITGRRKNWETAKPTKKYTNAIQHREDGSCCSGGKVNDSAVIALSNKPKSGIYYTADNADGYLICLYARVLIRRKE